MTHLESVTYDDPHLTSSEDSAEPVLDLRDLRERCLGSEPLMLQILEMLRGTLNEELERIRQAIFGGDFLGLAGHAHRLKGTAANVGARRMGQAAQQLEAFARHQCQNETLVCYERLQLECQQLCDTVSDCLEHAAV